MWPASRLVMEVLCCLPGSLDSPWLHRPSLGTWSLGPFPSLEEPGVPAVFGEIYVGGPVSARGQGRPGL